MDKKTYYIQSKELAHHGIKGMKWGVRKYQNKDGSLTPAGKKRYDRDVADNNARKKDNRIKIDGPDPKRWTREDVDRTKKVVDTTSDMVGQLKNIEKNTRPGTKKETLDLSKMTDQQLREKINRATLEKQYNNLFAKDTAKDTAKVSRGRNVVASILDTAGTVLALGSSALGIALAIKELKG